jgi:hypothetical protein
MTTVKVKGHEIYVKPVFDSFNRRAQKFKNNIITTLRKLGLTEDDVEIELETVAIKNVAASASWWYDGQNQYCSYGGMNKYVENLYVVSKVIELEVNAFLSGEKIQDDFIREFMEDKDIEEQRKEARKLLGVEPDCKDMDIINQKYKILAKKYHPDMPEGDIDMFKKINNAHKMLKRELQ